MGWRWQRGRDIDSLGGMVQAHKPLPPLLHTFHCDKIHFTCLIICSSFCGQEQVNICPFHPCPHICGHTGSSRRQIEPRQHHAMIPCLTFVWRHIVPAQLICRGEAVQQFLPGNWWGGGWQRCWRCWGVTEVVLLEGQRYLFSVQNTIKTSSSRIAVVPCI